MTIVDTSGDPIVGGQRLPVARLSRGLGCAEITGIFSSYLSSRCGCSPLGLRLNLYVELAMTHCPTGTFCTPKRGGVDREDCCDEAPVLGAPANSPPSVVPLHSQFSLSFGKYFHPDSATRMRVRI